MLTHDRFAQLMFALLAAFNRDGSEALLEAYWIALGEDLEDDELAAAVKRALKEKKAFMPTPAELLELAGLGRGDITDEGIIAWETVRLAIGRCGAYRSVVFDDPRITAAVRSLGGWVRLCGLEAADFEVWARKEFLKTFETWTRRGVPLEYAAHLPGVAELANGERYPAGVERVESLGAGGERAEIPAPAPRAGALREPHRDRPDRALRLVSGRSSETVVDAAPVELVTEDQRQENLARVRALVSGIEPNLRAATEETQRRASARKADEEARRALLLRQREQAIGGPAPSAPPVDHHHATTEGADR